MSAPAPVLAYARFRTCHAKHGPWAELSKDMPAVIFCSSDARASTLPLEDAQVPSGWGRNASGGSVSRMAVRQGQPWSDSTWSPDAAEQVHSLALCIQDALQQGHPFGENYHNRCA